MKRKIFLLIPLLILLVATVSAVAPWIDGDSITAGFILDPIRIHYHELNEDLQFETHVLNSTSGFALDGTNVDCNFHLYSNNGTVLVDRLMATEVGRHFDFDIDGANFSELGTYCVSFYCNDSSLGGFTLGCFEVTPNGEKMDNSQSALTIVTIVTILIFAGFLFLISYLFKKNIGMKIFFICLSVLFLIITFLYTMVVVDNHLALFPNIVQGYTTFWFIIKIFVYVSIIALGIFALLLVLKFWDYRRGYNR